jgi:lysophospholipase L1-like esterase
MVAVGDAADHRPRAMSLIDSQSSESDATPAPATGDIFLVLGDSIAAGIGASDPLTRGFAPIIRGYLERLSGRSVELVNLAVPRETTASFLANGQFDDALRVIEDARGAGLGVGPIVLSLGANDLLDAGEEDEEKEAAIASASENLQRAVDAIIGATRGEKSETPVELLAVTYVDPSGSNPDRPGSNAWWAARLNEAIVRAVEGAGGLAPDLTSLFRGREHELTWYPADIHPNNAGHAVIAKALWSATGYDFVPPSVALVRPESGPLSRPMPTIVATADDTVGVEGVSALLDGALLGDLAYHESVGAYLLLWDARSLPAGEHILQVVAIDAAGNTGTAAATVQANTSPSGTPVAAGLVAPPARRPAVPLYSPDHTGRDRAGNAGRHRATGAGMNG